MKKHKIDWTDVITVLIALMATALVAVTAWAVISSLQTEKQINTAKIRYFDGSTDTLQITRYSISDETVTVWTRDGQVCISSANNIILVSDDDYPRD